MFTIEDVEIALGRLHTCPSCSSPLLISSLIQAAESQSNEVLSPGTACEYLRRISDANLVQAESELNEVHADISRCKTQTKTQKLYYSLLFQSNCYNCYKPCLVFESPCCSLVTLSRYDLYYTQTNFERTNSHAERESAPASEREGGGWDGGRDKWPN
jgi:hypothetical protein